MRRSRTGPHNDCPDKDEPCIPDVRDGLTRLQRIVIAELARAAKETGRQSIPTAMLYGRVLERIQISEQVLQRVLRELIHDC